MNIEFVFLVLFVLGMFLAFIILQLFYHLRNREIRYYAYEKMKEYIDKKLMENKR